MNTNQFNKIKINLFNFCDSKSYNYCFAFIILVTHFYINQRIFLQIQFLNTEFFCGQTSNKNLIQYEASEKFRYELDIICESE